MNCWASSLTLTFGTTMMAELSALRAGHILPPKESPRYSFLLEAEWTPGLLNAHRRNRTIENFEGTYPESNPEPPVFWRSAICIYVEQAKTVSPARQSSDPLSIQETATKTVRQSQCNVLVRCAVLPCWIATL
jgi:hypothetical protein